jgi:hypothetical protein
LVRSRLVNLRRRLRRRGTGKRLRPTTRSTASTSGTENTSFANRWPTRPTGRSAQGSSTGSRKCRRNGTIAGGVEAQLAKTARGFASLESWPRSDETRLPKAAATGIRYRTLSPSPSARHHHRPVAAGATGRRDRSTGKCADIDIGEPTSDGTFASRRTNTFPVAGSAAEKPPISIWAAGQLSSFQRHLSVIDLC